jgi:hypothetical protein
VASACPARVSVSALLPNPRGGLLRAATACDRRLHVRPVGDTGASPPADVWTYTPKSFVRALAPAFRLEVNLALPVVLPPPYAADMLARFEGLPKLFERADMSPRNRFPFRGLGDHFEVIVRNLGRARAPSPYGL